MRLLLDTNALLWFLGGSAAMGRTARAALEARDTDARVSLVSLWEVAIKVRVGKLDADISVLIHEVTAVGFALLPIIPAHLFALADLPRIPGHRDPFDHLLLAQARAEGCTLVTADGRLGGYGVPLLDARA